MKFFTSFGSMTQMGAGMALWRFPVTARKPGMATRPTMAAMAAAMPAPTELVLELELEPVPGLPGLSEGLSEGSSGWPAESSAPRVKPTLTGSWSEARNGESS